MKPTTVAKKEGKYTLKMTLRGIQKKADPYVAILHHVFPGNLLGSVSLDTGRCKVKWGGYFFHANLSQTLAIIKVVCARVEAKGWDVDHDVVTRLYQAAFNELNK